MTHHITPTSAVRITYAVLGRECEVQIRRVLSSGVVLLALAMFPLSGAALPLDRSPQRAAVLEFILSSYAGPPKSTAGRIRDRVFTLPKDDLPGPTDDAPREPPAIGPIGFAAPKIRFFRASGASRFFANVQTISSPMILPEPATGTLVGGGLLLMAALGRRRQDH